MSNSSSVSNEGEHAQASKVPRAMIHKQILDAAAARPSASIEELATAVSGASLDLVERVLDEYGDPAERPPGLTPADGTNGHSGSDSDGGTSPSNGHSADLTYEVQPDRIDVTEKQRQTLHAIAERPNATQRELAEVLDVSPATINKRVNSIDGFQWAERHAFIATMVESGNMNPDTAEERGELTDRIDILTERVTDIERRLEEQPAPSASLFDDPDLVHKVVHACMHSEHITEDEELRIIHTILTDVGGPD